MTEQKTNNSLIVLHCQVSEVFLTAGQAFQKLSGLIANLRNPKNGVERFFFSSN